MYCRINREISCACSVWTRITLCCIRLPTFISKYRAPSSERTYHNREKIRFISLMFIKIVGVAFEIIGCDDRFRPWPSSYTRWGQKTVANINKFCRWNWRNFPTFQGGQFPSRESPGTPMPKPIFKIKPNLSLGFPYLSRWNDFHKWPMS